MTGYKDMLYIFIITAMNIVIWYAVPFFLLQCRFRPTVLRVGAFLTLQFVLVVGIRYVLSFPFAFRSIVGLSIIFVPMMVMFKDSLRKRAFVTVSLFILTFAGEFLMQPLILAVDKNGAINGDEFCDGSMIGRVLWLMVTYILFACFVLLYKVWVDKKRFAGMILYVIVPFYQALMLFMYYYNCKEFNGYVAVYGISFCVLGLLIDFLIIYFQTILERKQEMEMRLDEIQKQRDYELQYCRQADRNMEQMQALQRDFAGQLQAVYEMIHTGREESQIEKMLGESESRLRASSLIQYCENSVVNALISVKAQEAAARGVLFNVQCSLGEVPQIEEIDLCSIFGNLLDNALEECGRLNTGERSIRLWSGLKGGYQAVQVENTCRNIKRSGEYFYTTDKADKENHGMGMRLIEQICKKYNGELLIQAGQRKIRMTAYVQAEGDANDKNSDM